MKTIVTCVLLAALAFGILPGTDGQVQEEEQQDMVLLVDNTAQQDRPVQQSLAESSAAPPEENGDQQTIRLLSGNTVLTLSMQDYLTGVLLSEMPADFAPEARRAQAVAARTFTRKKLEHPKHEDADVCGDYSCCQAWTSTEVLKEKYGADFESVWRDAQEIVRQTAGEVLTYDGQLIDAVYFSCSGGETEPAIAVWGSDVPYLQSVESPGEQDAPRYSSQSAFSAAEFAALLREENPAVQLTGQPESWLGAVCKSAGGGVESIEIGGELFSGTEIRRIFGLNSTKFTLHFQDGSFLFDVLGFGHRVGMSQYGAEAMAELGFSHRTILEYYYQGARVEKT